MGECRDNILDARLGGEFDRRRREAKPQGAQADLIDRLLAGNIDDATALRGKRGAGLNDQRRFADAGFAAKQKNRARHETAAGYPVEFGDAGGDAGGGRAAVLDKARKAENPAFSRVRGSRAYARGCAFLGDGVPPAAGVATALPALADRAAILANEGSVRLGHRSP